jgi:hypothetical protein
MQKPSPETAQLPKLRRLFWDSETSFNVVLSWRIGYKIKLDHDNILKERAIICIGWKWEGDPKVHVLAWDRFQNDKAMLAEFLEVANSADELVAHHGDYFDAPWFRTRCLYHGLQPLPDYKTVDTCAWAKRLCMFNSNSIAYIAKFLKVGEKIKTDFDLWKKIVLDKDPAALKLMTDYCKRDVEILEGVWNKLRVITKPKTHVGVLGGGEKWTCAHCGSEKVKKDKTRVTALGIIQHQMRCRACNAYFTISDLSYKKYLDR